MTTRRNDEESATVTGTNFADTETRLYVLADKGMAHFSLSWGRTGVREFTLYGHNTAEAWTRDSALRDLARVLAHALDTRLADEPGDGDETWMSDGDTLAPQGDGS